MQQARDGACPPYRQALGLVLECGHAISVKRSPELCRQRKKQEQTGNSTLISLPDGPLTRDDAIALLTSPGSLFETSSKVIRGIEFDVFTNAPNDMRDYFVVSNAHFADNEFLIYEDERLTYGEVHQKTIALCHALQDLGVQPGDRVAVSMRNYPEYCLAVEAILSIGAVGVTLNSWWRYEELEYGLRDSGSRFAFLDQERWERLGDSRELLDLGVALTRPDGEVPEGVLNMADLMKPVPGAAFPTQPIDTDSDALIMYTSGSTGHPKGVVMTHRSIISALMGFGFGGIMGAIMQDEDKDLRQLVFDWLNKGPDAFKESLSAQFPASATLLSVPLFHVSGLHTMLFMSYRAGRKLVFMHKWNAEKALELTEKESLTSLEGVPTMIGEVLNSPDVAKRDLSSLVSIGGGGSARPPEHVKVLQERFPQAMSGTGYGMTETNAIGTGIGGEEYLERPDSVGRALPPLIQIEIRDTEGNVLAPNEDGEVCMKSAANMRCYWNKPEATAEALQDGWMMSGDIGHLDEEGFVFITGRAKDMIIRGGENIACGEIEKVLYEHPSVFEAAVHGAPDDRLGEIVCAAVYLKNGCSATVEDIKDHVGLHLATFKVPSHVFFVTEPLPRIATGKFDKRALQKQTLERLQKA